MRTTWTNIQLVRSKGEENSGDCSPKDAASASKNTRGKTKTPGEAVRADSGIVFAQNRPFVLCVMTSYLSDEKEGARAIQKVTAAAFPYFDMVGRASEYGRVISPRNAR